MAMRPLGFRFEKVFETGGGNEWTAQGQSGQLEATWRTLGANPSPLDLPRPWSGMAKVRPRF